MNAALTYFRARGMGSALDPWGDFSGVYGADSGTGHSTRDAIVGLTNQGLNLLGNIFGRNNQQPTYAPQPTAYGQTPYGAAPGSQVSAGIGGAFNNFAGTLGISPSTLAIVGVGAAVLLFMKPPSRR